MSYHGRIIAAYEAIKLAIPTAPTTSDVVRFLHERDELKGDRNDPRTHAKIRSVIFPHAFGLDPGIKETVRFCLEHGFLTTDSGDGVSKPPEARVMDFPHVVMTTRPHDLHDEATRLLCILTQRGIDIGPQDGTNPAIEASYDVGAGIATILLSGVTDALMGLDRHWVGDRCGIRTRLDTIDPKIGDVEDCVLCEAEGCKAEVVTGSLPEDYDP